MKPIIAVTPDLYEKPKKIFKDFIFACEKQGERYVD